MKRTGLLTVMALLGVLASGFVAFRATAPRAPPPFPCVRTSKDGWLTAVGGGVLLRVEWGPGLGRVGVAPERSPVAWRDVTEAEARATVLEVLSPLSEPVGSSTEGTMSLFVACDGRGAYEREDSGPAATLRECLNPRGESRFACVRRVLADRRSRAEKAGAVIDRMLAEAERGGVTVPRPAPAAPGLGGLLGGPPPLAGPGSGFGPIID